MYFLSGKTEIKNEYLTNPLRYNFFLYKKTFPILNKMVIYKNNEFMFPTCINNIQNKLREY